MGLVEAVGAPYGVHATQRVPGCLAFVQRAHRVAVPVEVRDGGVEGAYGVAGSEATAITGPSAGAHGLS